MTMDILRSIVGIEVFPVVSLVLFVVVFSGAVVHAWCADGARMDRLAALPLDDAGGTDRSLPAETRRPL